MEIDLSVVVPIHNERENLRTLLKELTDSLSSLGCRYEILCVDDASTDRSGDLLQELSTQSPFLHIIRLRRHAGQTAALSVGFRQARGEAVITMDADLQNDPADIPRLLDELQKGFDVVSGWRRRRQDPWVRSLLSKTANGLLAVFTRVPLHDSGCTLKAYRREVLQGLVPYGEMHRILPAYLAALGCHIGEIEVRHRPRRFGKSKYGIGRVVRVLLDILAVSFVLRFASTPIRAFGGIGLLTLAFGMLAASCVVVRAIVWGGVWISPMIFVATILVISGIQFIALGLLGEMLLWTRATDPRGKTYVTEEEILHAKD